jgi:citrate lyase subunit alpha/citrate CoA-transferase
MKPLPDHIDGYGAVRAFAGALPPPALVALAATRIAPHARGRDKLLTDIDAAFVACGLDDGATLALHHHLRNGKQWRRDADCAV